jgi:endoglucanase
MTMQYLQALSEAVGVSGDEEAVRKIILEAISGHVDDIRIDPIGNITAFKRGTGGDNLPRVMLAAHMDEIGFMVTGFDNNGLIRFTPVGSVDERILPALRVKIGAEGVNGVIIWTPIHKNREQKIVKQSNLRIDIGASNKDGATAKVKKGDRIVFDSAFYEIGEHVLRGKAFDDRAGCSLLIDLIQNGHFPVDLSVAFTVQEEIGLRGAIVAGNTLKPDMAIILEGTTANDIPDPSADPDTPSSPNPTSRMGGGPVLTVMDRSMIAHPRLLQFMRDTADNHHIPYQLKTQMGGATDGGSIHTSGVGVPTSVVSLPCRYIHTPSAYLNKNDYHHAYHLVSRALQAVNWDVLR